LFTEKAWDERCIPSTMSTQTGAAGKFRLCFLLAEVTNQEFEILGVVRNMDQK